MVTKKSSFQKSFVLLSIMLLLTGVLPGRVAAISVPGTSAYKSEQFFPNLAPTILDLVNDFTQSEDSPLLFPNAASVVTTGDNHTCALTKDGMVKCWGGNEYGQLGDGTTTDRLTPVTVVGLSSGVSAVIAGFGLSCALTNEGAVKCWGRNDLGQLGDGTITNRLTPVNVVGLTSGVAAIDSGLAHTCALMIAGFAKCWGMNYYGELGDGTTSNKATPVVVSELSGNTVAAINTGYEYTCALIQGGAVKCWGRNDFGQLGNGTATNRLTPGNVSGLSSGVTALTAGAYHTCALTAGGSMKCWGRNDIGQLGDGAITNRLVPVTVSGLTSEVATITAGGFHTCALTAAEAAKCWGNNGNGQLGDGTSTRQIIPIAVTGLTSGNATIAVGSFHTCVVTTSGEIKCWGANYYGQLGDGTTTDRYTAVDVIGFDISSPLILVHGWQGLNFKDWGYQCSNDGNGANDIERYQRFDATHSNSTLKSENDETALADWFVSEGYEVWIAHLESSPLGTPSLEFNANCLKDQIEYVYTQNPHPMIIVAHSMGGLVSRAAIIKSDSNIDIEALYTLGSPHAGFPFNIMQMILGHSSNQIAFSNMSAVSMIDFNRRNPTVSTTDYYFIGGDATPFGLGSLLFPSIGFNDGLTGKYSAVGWMFPNQVFTSYWANYLDGQYWTGETHSTSVDPHNNYYTAPPGDLDSSAFVCMKSLIKHQDMNNVSWACEAGGISSPSIPEQTISVQANSAFSALTELETGHLVESQSISIPLEIDTSAASMFYLTWKGGIPAFTLTRPDNQVIDPGYAASHITEVSYETSLGGAETAPYTVYDFTTTQPGIWHLNITATGALDYQGFAALESNRILTVQTDTDVYQIGDAATITAHLDSGGTNLSGATVTATLTHPNDVLDVISLVDQGNGAYTNTYTIPDVPGYLTIDVTATGSDDGTAFSRQENLLVAIAPNDLQLTGNYDDQPRDDNADGLYDFLDFTAEVNLDIPGDYAVFAELYAGDQLITRSGDFFPLVAGTQTISLAFDGGVIRELALNGPYTIKNLYFTPIDMGITAASIEIAWTTDAYSYSQFLGSFTGSFNDVQTDYWAWSFIERLYSAGITGGCGTSPLQYCPETTVTRSQMAVFLERGIHGSSYSPPAVGASTGFGDVPVDYWSAAWIKQLAAEGITGGCGSGNYCPEYPVTRDQMAVFLLRSKYGSLYSPPAVGSITGFGDVPVDHWAAPWIKQLVTEGITAGCGSGNYCPGIPVSRAQMAVFLVRTFNLP